MITIDLIPDFLGSKLTLQIEICQVSLRILCFRIFWGSKLALKKEVVLGNLKVFVLVVGGGWFGKVKCI